MALLKFKPTAVVPKVCIIGAAVVNAANQLGLTQDRARMGLYFAQITEIALRQSPRSLVIIPPTQR